MRSKTIKKERRNDVEDLLSTPPDAPQETTTTMPVRAVSIASSAAPAAGPSANGQGDVEMDNAETPAGPSAMEVLGSRSRQLIKVIQKLETLGIDSTLPSLPKFVVIGDQSAGKSSIIEAACDITLPRSEGTCTRCPFHITTTASSEAEAWTCHISIHQKHGYDPQTQAGQHGAEFDKWLNQDHPAVIEFATVHTKQELDAALRRAQLAVLNPQHHPSAYRNVDLGKKQTQKVGFSPNVISLEIAAPGLPEMSFYDLPGAINTMGDESLQHLVKFVEDLLKKYIRDDKAFLLLAHAANQDLEVSTALRFLRECRATNRSMGILTKPDLVDLTPGRVTYLADLLRNETDFRIGQGWYITRQLSQKELDREQAISHEQARQLEGDFFSNEPWSTRLAGFANRFGIPNLQSTISRNLTGHILEALPEIQQRVQSRLSEVDQQLSTFPDQAIAPSLTVITEIDKIKTEIVKQLNADSLTSKFRKPYRDIFRTFSKKLQELKPRVVLTTPGYIKPSISIDDSDEEETPSKSRRTNNGRGTSVVNSTPHRSGGRPARRTPASSSRSSAQDNGGKVTFFLDDVKIKFDSAPGADIPGQSSDAVVRSLISDTLSGWVQVTDSVLHQVQEVFLEMLQGTVAEALAQRANTELHRQVGQITVALFEELMQDVTGFVYKLIAAEIHRPITYNEQLKAKRTTHENDLRQRRAEQRAEEHYDTAEAEGYKALIKPKQKEAVDANKLNTVLGPDDYEREVKALATPMAYYELASAQLVDCVAKQFESGLMSCYESQINRKLAEDLRATDTEYCAHLLAEDPERERQRQDFLEERLKLEEALKELNTLPEMHVPN